MEKENNQVMLENHYPQYDFSIIIPHRNSIDLLRKLISSIPQSERIEIIVVDNSLPTISKNDIVLDRQYQLLYSSPEKGAGGARNVGLDNAHGEWLVFADADDYFTSTTFSQYSTMLLSDADVIYSCAEGKYIDTGDYSDRADVYNKLIGDYLSGEKTELDLRLGIPVPWCKMIRREFVERHKIRFDEIVAGNDIYFSLLIGYYARKIAAIEDITYVVTVSKGTLTKRRDFETMYARLYSKLHCNHFLREHGLANYQHSVMFALAQSRHYGFAKSWKIIKMIAKYHQNPFIGWKNWLKTSENKRTADKIDSKYIVK